MTTLDLFACLFIITSMYSENFLDDCNYNDYNIGSVRLKLIGVMVLRSFYKWSGLIK